MSMRYYDGDRVMDYETYQRSGHAHLGYVVGAEPIATRYGYRVSVVWDTDPVAEPEVVYSDCLARVSGELVG